MLEIESVDGEIALVIQYEPGKSEALQVLEGAMRLISSIDALDHCLLSSIDTSLEPVSILNDVQHSSLKILLARALRRVPDDAISDLNWKKWIGDILVKGKWMLLNSLEADAPQLQKNLDQLKDVYESAPQLTGYSPPRITDVQDAIEGFNNARAKIGSHKVTIQTEMGDIDLPPVSNIPEVEILSPVVESRTNRAREYLKVKSPDMLGNAQWTVIRSGRTTRIDLLHREWLDNYQAGKVVLLPGDSLDCTFEETVDYDADKNEVGRQIAVIEVHDVIHPPQQTALNLTEF